MKVDWHRLAAIAFFLSFGTSVLWSYAILLAAMGGHWTVTIHFNAWGEGIFEVGMFLAVTVLSGWAAAWSMREYRRKR